MSYQIIDCITSGYSIWILYHFVSIKSYHSNRTNHVNQIAEFISHNICPVLFASVWNQILLMLQAYARQAWMKVPSNGMTSIPRLIREIVMSETYLMETMKKHRQKWSTVAVRRVTFLSQSVYRIRCHFTWWRTILPSVKKSLEWR